MEIVLHRLSNVLVPNENDEADSVKRSRLQCHGDRARAQEILIEAQNYYNAMYRFRKDRERNKRYNYGDQWGDVVCVDGKKMTEEQYILSQGNIPLKTNLIRRLVRNVIGVYRSQATEPTCTARDRDEQQQAETMSTVLQYNMQLNRMTELYARSMEEYLISGMVAHRKWYGWRNDKMECWTDYVQPNNFFIDNNMRDFRAWDCSFVGEIHDVSFGQVCEQFAKSPDDYARLAEIYRQARDKGASIHAWEEFGYSRDWINTDFLTPRDESRCRVIEVWRKESKPRYRCHDYNNGEVYKIDVEDYEVMVGERNRERMRMGLEAGIPYNEIPFIKAEWFMDSYWYYYFLSPLGDILAEGETPYEHKSHPYVFKAYPFIDGEIHSFVSDVIDQQRYTNRLITLNDWVIRASAKGVLLIPDECIPKGMTPEEFADTWARFNGVVVYTPSKTGAVPTQVSNNSTNIGIHEMLNLMLKFFEDISGVNGACLSQWYDCYFEVDGVRYHTTEQYMMASKARLFGDKETLREVMSADTPNDYKQFGRKVRGFESEPWDALKYEIVVRGNKAKFSQNPELKEFLLSTGDAILAEASPYDTVWGIGLGWETAQKVTVGQWEGENLLGCALMEVRDWLRHEVRNSDKRKKRVFVDMDNVLVDFESGLAQVSEELKHEYEGRLDEIPGLFGPMKPMPGAIEAVHELQKHYDLFILSTAPWKNPSAWSDKVKWVTKYLDDVFHKRMVLTHRKDLCQGDYLIDDRDKNGTSEFAGEWIEFGSEKFPDWNSVLEYLNTKEQ